MDIVELLDQRVAGFVLQTLQKNALIMKADNLISSNFNANECQQSSTNFNNLQRTSTIFNKLQRTSTNFNELQRTSTNTDKRQHQGEEKHAQD